MVDLAELYMVDFGVIMEIDWLHAFFASISCRTRTVKFNCPNEPILERKCVNSIPRGRIIFYLKDCKIISKWCLYNILMVKDLESDISHTAFVPKVKDFPELFFDDFPRIPPEWETNVCIDI